MFGALRASEVDHRGTEVTEDTEASRTPEITTDVFWGAVGRLCVLCALCGSVVNGGGEGQRDLRARDDDGMQIAIVGSGKMGRAVAALAEERGHAVRVIGREENAGGAALTRERLDGVDVAIEFTRPDAVVANLERLIEAGVPTVTGTTGWAPELPRVQRLVESRGGALLHASNFSVGVHLFLRAASELASRFAGRSERWLARPTRRASSQSRRCAPATSRALTC